MTVISASRRTDLPAFHGAWLRRRLQEGFCEVRHPFTGAVNHVDLTPEAVDAFVFWSKDFSRFQPLLDEAEALGHRVFAFQYTLNAYPAWLEPRVAEPTVLVKAAQALAKRYSPAALVWRYDPILITRELSIDDHLRRFGDLARRLEGATEQVTTSFLDRYRKTDRNLLPILAERGDRLEDPGLLERREWVERLAAIARRHGMGLSLCCETDLLSPNTAKARCVDRDRLGRLAGRPLDLPARPTRKGCGCHASVDIGGYDTCPHGCRYCYANAASDVALRRTEVDPAHPILEMAPRR